MLQSTSRGGVGGGCLPGPGGVGGGSAWSRGGCLPGLGVSAWSQEEGAPWWGGGFSLVPGGSPCWGGLPGPGGGGVSAWSGRLPGGGGGCLPGPGGVLWRPLPVNRITDTCKNITLATTSLRPVKINISHNKLPLQNKNQNVATLRTNLNWQQRRI